MRHALVTILFSFAMVLGPSAGAWDTKEFSHELEVAMGQTFAPGYENWRSLWLCDRSVSIGASTTCGRNEHEWLSDRALTMLISGSNPWAIRTPTDLFVVDLNSSYFRPDLVDGSDPNHYQRAPSSWTGPLEERDLASPPHFAGIADFTYTIYDWINKNRLCPPHPSGEQRHCHNYSVWMGAGYNASHFGSQAAYSYRSLHQTALWSARHAAALRSSLEGQDEATQLVFEDNIREAELMALAYEGAAQHFLQDRWSSGHMWERWNGPEFNSNPYSSDIGQAAVIGAFSGVIHGSEAVTTLPLPLSSPLPGALYGVNPAEWRPSTSDDTEYGVGDYRAEDMFDGLVGGDYLFYGYSESTLNVSAQRSAMMRCLTASYREVIQAFGAGPNGGYGIDSVNTRGSGSVTPDCTDAWATNWSIWKAWGVLNASDTFTESVVPYVVRTMLPGNARIDSSEVETHSAETAGELLAAYYGVGISLTVDRASLARISSRIFWNGTFRGDGIDLATGGMGPFGRAQPGAHYNAPSYLEPRDLSTLTAEDPRGRDGNSIHGFFNRAFAGQYCTGAQQRLERLRLEIRTADTEDERNRYRGVCRYLAQRVFAETRSDYRGPMRSYQVAPDTSSGASSVTQITPVCAWQPSGAITAGPDDDSLPYYLHPGYVPFNFSTDQPNNAQWSDTFGAWDSSQVSWGYAQRSVANWCDQTPVIDVVEGEGDAARDIVAVVADADARIELYGLNFGAGRGRVLVGRTWNDAVLAEEVIRWYDDRITFVLGDQINDVAFNTDDEAYIFIEKESTGDSASRPGFRSVGRFVLLNDIPKPQIVSMRVHRGGEDFLTYEAPEPPEDPGPRGTPAPDPELGAFRPITPGEVEIEIEFDMPIAEDDEETRIALNTIDIEDNHWRDGGRRWIGRIDIPDGDEYASTYRGVQPIVVNVRAADGGWIDGDPSSPGPQPDNTNMVLVDTIPTHVERIQVRGGGRTVYSAEWSGGPDLDEEDNLTTQALGDPERMLRVSTARAAPATGQGRLRFELSSPVEEAPMVLVGGATVTMEGEGNRWQGTFDYEEAANGAVEGDLPISISGTDLAGKGLDADPRSVAQILPLGSDYYNFWARYEASRGDANTSASGGADTWHRIGEPPALSMVIILDASGSMGENGRMENAKAGIQQTLDGLPEDQRIELAGVVFYSCGSMNTTGFTRNIQTVRDFLLGASPSGGTPLAEAHGYARNLLATNANPGAMDWRYVTFTDGAETCDGNVAAATQDLEQLLRDHRNLSQGRDPEEPDDEEVAREALPEVNCTPASWRAYQVGIDDRGSDLNEIALLEHWYIERALPDGRCFARLETKTYLTYYGSIRNRNGGPARSDWGINSRASNETSDFGTSRLGATDLDRVRNAAQTLRGNSVSLEAARGEIAAAVQAALAEQEDS